MAHQVVERVQFGDEQREAMLFLIGHHLRMSMAAFGCDNEDPDIVRQFAALVGTEERLKMLCLMTLVDIEAVSPETLTPWKAELLWRLFVASVKHPAPRRRREPIQADQAGRREPRADRSPAPT